MALEQKLSLKLGQRLVMTPSLQQAIKLLQMTRMELQAVLTQEMVENPMLDDGEEVYENDGADEAGEQAAEESEELDHEASLDDIDLEAYFNDYWEGSTEPRVYEHAQAPPLENRLTREPDLYDHLLFQLHMGDISLRQRLIGELIIGNLDPDGFLVASLEELEALGPEDEPFRREEIEQALALIQSFDPPGIACRDLRECLLAQLAASGVPKDSLAYRVVDEAWKPFLRRQFAAIAKQLGIDLPDLEPAIDIIRELELRPGRQFSNDRTLYVEPDVSVVKVGDEYVIQLNDDGMPRLRINGAYRRMLRHLKKEGGEKDAREYIKDKLRSALWLIKSLDQRQRTIYKVVDSLIRQQFDFLERGIEHLRPMVLRDVADDIGMHESTVSRVVSNKYIHTPRGLFPLKFFFHSGIDRDYGENISSLTVKRKIEHFVQSEDPRHPMSDSGITEALRREGIHIARRTVAKYRDELHIPSSTHRKQIF